MWGVGFFALFCAFWYRYGAKTTN